MSISQKITKVAITVFAIALLATPVFAQNVTTNTATNKTQNTTNTTQKQVTSTTKSNVSSVPVALEKLTITGAKLEPNFSKDVYQYKAEYEGDAKTLEIVAQPNQSNANVEIIGNDNLINGTNIINIIVSDAKETQAATYQIYLNKNLIQQEELNKQLQEAENKYQIKQWIIRGLIITIAICIIILLILLYKRSNSEEYQKRKSNKRLKKYSNIDKEADKEDKKSGKHRK